MSREPQLNETLNTAFESSSCLQNATESLYQCQSILHYAQITLRNAQDIILCENSENPKALGTNEATRDANLRAMTREEQKAVDEAELALLQARCQSEVAKMVWDFGRFSLRLMELTVEMEKHDE